MFGHGLNFNRAQRTRLQKTRILYSVGADGGRASDECPLVKISG